MLEDEIARIKSANAAALEQLERELAEAEADLEASLEEDPGLERLRRGAGDVRAGVWLNS